MSVKLLAPNKAQQYSVGGVSYTPDDNSILSVPADVVDDLLEQGCTYPPASSGFKNNYVATTNPGVTDDLDAGYGVGSVWVNVTLGIVWTMVASTDGAAVWVEAGTPAALSVATGITAFATGGQASATALTAQYNNVTVCATAADSVKLLAAAAGLKQTVKNNGAATLAVFPATGDTINALAANLSVDIPPGCELTFSCLNTTAWQTSGGLYSPSPTTQTGGLLIEGAANAGNTTTKIVNASQAAARTYTVPDAGANASFLQSEGAQTVNGVKTFTGLQLDPATTLTAAGTDRATSLVLTKQVNNITTAGSGTGVTAPAASAMGICFINNLGANPIVIYGSGSDTIDGAAAATGVPLANTKRVVLVRVAAATWISLMGIPSA